MFMFFVSSRSIFMDIQKSSKENMKLSKSYYVYDFQLVHFYGTSDFVFQLMLDITLPNMSIFQGSLENLTEHIKHRSIFQLWLRSVLTKICITFNRKIFIPTLPLFWKQWRRMHLSFLGGEINTSNFLGVEFIKIYPHTSILSPNTNNYQK